MTQPDILILEGLNVLQSGTPRRQGPQRVFVSDFFDFSIYVDADEQDIENWYVERFMTLRETVFRDPTSYFSHYAALTPDEARDVARGIWSSINLRQPAREHPADARARAPDPRQGGHACRRAGVVAAAVMKGSQAQAEG